MDPAYLHLVLNHIPIIGVPFALLFLGYSQYIGHAGLKQFSLVVLIGVSALILPVYFTGEPAEEVAEHLAGVSERDIHEHEEAAELTLVLTLLAGATALAALVLGRKSPQLDRYLPRAVFAAGTVAVLGMVYTARLGGKIRHTEFHSTPASEQPGPAAEEGAEDDD